tara:strand:+ start:1311 stop:1616 length:306 start_codon:yes stop_codon:yes gene_type:complete
MNSSDDDKQFEVLRKLHKNSKLTQRKLADELGYSLGKLNFILNELKKKGMVKYKNFKNNENKINYLYVLTPKGVTKKTKLLYKFMERKLKEYDELKKEIEK